ncbi:MAG: Rad52/Rad22 family DNA repair protein [Synechococcus sp.]|nr:Rad52/Rad22 family DNA repair protein [Synechococcus sp.]
MQLGIEAQELTTAIGQLAEQLEADDPEKRALALAELEAVLLAEEGNKAALAAKADATCWVIEHLRGQATYRQQQAKRLTDLARPDAGRADALEESLVFVLTQLQPAATRFSFPNHELSSRKSQSVVLSSSTAAPGVSTDGHRSSGNGPAARAGPFRFTSTHFLRFIAMSTSVFSPDQIAALSAPLDRAKVKQREQGRPKVSYLEGWQAIAEANRIFGFDGWQRETIAVPCVAERERTLGSSNRAGWGVT